MLDQHELGRRGMELAADHAEHEMPGWQDEALCFVAAFCRASTKPFLAEEIRPWAHARGLSFPPDGRAWGAVIRRASREGVMVKTGDFAVNRLSGHGSCSRPLWKAA